MACAWQKVLHQVEVMARTVDGGLFVAGAWQKVLHQVEVMARTVVVDCSWRVLGKKCCTRLRSWLEQ